MKLVCRQCDYCIPRDGEIMDLVRHLTCRHKKPIMLPHQALKHFELLEIDDEKVITHDANVQE